MRRKISVWAVIFILVMALVPTQVLAQEGESPDGDTPDEDSFMFTNEDGQLSWDITKLHHVDTVIAEPPEGWPHRQIPIRTKLISGDIGFGMMSYYKFVTPDKKYVIVPNAYTTYVLAREGLTPFDAPPSEAIVNPLIWVPGLTGAYEDTVLDMSRDDILAGIEISHEIDAEAMRDLVHAGLDPRKEWFNQGAFFIPGGIFVYDCDPEDPECAAYLRGEDPEVIPPAPVSTCGDPKIVDAEIHVTGELVDPPYPVVVGQDPNKRGADLLWRVEITPVIYTWYETKEIGEETICRYVGSGGGGGGCPAPGSKYDRVLGADRWYSSMEGNNEWKSEKVPIIECVEHIEVYPVQLTSVRTSASLSEVSRDWIEHGGLQQRYPGAHLYIPDWQWLPPLYGNVLDNGVYVWEWTLEDIQFRDPGQYGMSVQGSITGTPVTKPRVFNMEASGFSVWLYEATLVQ
jgi:hypothetical protein